MKKKEKKDVFLEVCKEMNIPILILEIMNPEELPKEAEKKETEE